MIWGLKKREKEKENGNSATKGYEKKALIKPTQLNRGRRRKTKKSQRVKKDICDQWKFMGIWLKAK